eukprot:s3759_g4.t1
MILLVCEHGKNHFRNSKAAKMADRHVTLYSKKGLLTKVVPVIHYTMGGIAINVEGQVLDKDQKVIPGLYAIGEASGGVHGDNRLAGNSLLECTVFGRHVGMALPIRTGSAASGAASSAITSVSSPTSVPSEEPLRKITQEERDGTFQNCLVTHGVSLPCPSFGQMPLGINFTVAKPPGKTKRVLQVF